MKKRANATPCQSLLARYPDTPLADIPWQELPPHIQATCWWLIQDWRSDTSKGLDMTLPELFAYQKEMETARAEKRYRLISYLRVDPENDEAMTYEDALVEKKQQELLFPENIYQIEDANTECPTDRRENALYSPKVKEDLVERLYPLCRELKIPMTAFVNGATQRALVLAQERVAKGQKGEVFEMIGLEVPKDTPAQKE